ncbi:hypothetical protein BC831DRAFT_449662 [Entophlyctis helioformis]|nr:hypothetical protein BC831DRAFT_449662 [Entophlyctis helioformis]
MQTAMCCPWLCLVLSAALAPLLALCPCCCCACLDLLPHCRCAVWACWGLPLGGVVASPAVVRMAAAWCAYGQVCCAARVCAAVGAAPLSSLASLATTHTPDLPVLAHARHLLRVPDNSRWVLLQPDRANSTRRAAWWVLRRRHTAHSLPLAGRAPLASCGSCSASAASTIATATGTACHMTTVRRN